MSVVQALHDSLPRFADGSFRPMLIDGEWVPAVSGKTFETRNPATGELLATVAEGDKADIDRAVVSARRAFEGPWGKMKPFERQQIMLKWAELVEAHHSELALLDTLDMGAPISRMTGSFQRVLTDDSVDAAEERLDALAALLGHRRKAGLDRLFGSVWRG